MMIEKHSHRTLSFAGALLILLASAKVASATTISNGVYIGAPGADASGSEINNGGEGGAAFTFSTGANSVSGGSFGGGQGGNATGGMEAHAGEGGDAVDESGGSLTITGGSFQAGAAGTASGADANISSIAGIAFTLNGYSTSSSGLVYGGTFQGYYDFYIIDATLNIYGTFTDGPRTITAAGIGTFSGLLADNQTPATYTYDISGGEIILEPEPTTCSLIAFSAFLLFGRARRRR